MLETEGHPILVLGFDSAEEGVVIAGEHRALYQRLDSFASHTVARYYDGDPATSSPAYDYAP